MSAKLCDCGCGLPAPIARRNDKRFGHVKGQPMRFINGHRARVDNPNSSPLVGRFWKKVNKNGPMPSTRAIGEHSEIAGTNCWEWTGAQGLRYGNILANGKSELAHRVAWFLETGEWPKSLACHKCDNPKCVRYSHLFNGTHQDNSTDMFRKGRAKPCSGEDHPSAKLTQAQVREIRAQLDAGVTQMTLATRYGVVQSVISAIKLRQHWKS